VLLVLVLLVLVLLVLVLCAFMLGMIRVVVVIVPLVMLAAWVVLVHTEVLGVLVVVMLILGARCQSSAECEEECRSEEPVRGLHCASISRRTIPAFQTVTALRGPAIPYLKRSSIRIDLPCCVVGSR
jgi:hypothetical protein